MIGILGKKIGMTQLFKEDGSVLPLTLIEVGPCYVLQVKTEASDGYKAIQVGFDPKKENRVIKPLKGHFAKAKVKPVRFIKEIRVDSTDQYKVGQTLTVDIFQEKDLVDVTGVSIGKGFQGGVKRWGWAGGKKTHGSMHHRAPGSIGQSSYPSRVFKGQHLPGRMGGETKTIQNIEIVKVDKEANLLAVKGSIPGHKNSYLIIKEARKHPIVRKSDEKPDKAKTDKEKTSKSK